MFPVPLAWWTGNQGLARGQGGHPEDVPSRPVCSGWTRSEPGGEGRAGNQLHHLPRTPQAYLLVYYVGWQPVPENLGMEGEDPGTHPAQPTFLTPCRILALTSYLYPSPAKAPGGSE